MKESEGWNTLGVVIDAQKQGRLHEMIGEVKRVWRYAKKRDFNQLRYHFASLIHHYNFVIKQDAKAGRLSANELKVAKALRDAEDKARTAHTELTFKLNQSRHLSNTVRAELKKFCDEHIDLIDLKNASISIFVYNMLIFQAYLQQNYKSVIEHCEASIALCKEKKLNKSHHFQLQMMSALILSKQYEKASKTIAEAKRRIPGKRYSWSVFVYFETINLLHAERYKVAYKKLLEADSKEQINPAMKEQWQIAKGFFQILSNAGYIKDAIRFRISKIVNEVPIFYKDKYGNFINILMLKIILGIQENRDRLIEEREGIEKAYQRYCLKGSRERVFMRILLRVPLHRFNKARVEKACEKDIALLHSIPMHAENLDIIPWFKLLEIVFKSLR